MTMTAGADRSAELRPPSRRRSVAARLRHTLVAFIGVVLLVGIVGGLAARLSDAAAAELRRLDDLALARLRLDQDARDAGTGLRAFLATGDEELLGGFERAAHDWDPAAADARALADGDATLVDLVDRQHALGRRWFDDLARPAIESRRGATGTPAAAAATTTGLDAAQVTLAGLLDAGEQARTAIDAERQAVAGRVGTTGRAVTAACLLAALVGGGVGLLLLRRVDAGVAGPLDDLSRTLARLTSGDLTARVAPRGAGELGAVGRATNDLAAQIEQLRLVEQRRAEQDRAMSRVSRAIREHLEVGPTLDAAAREVGHALQADRVVVRGVIVESPGRGRLGPVLSVWDRPQGARKVPAAHGTRVRSPAPFASRATRSITELVGDAYLEGSLFWIDDAWTDERLDEKTRKWFDSGEVRAVVVVPVKTGESAYALIVQSRKAPRTWTEAELTLLGAVARDLAVALQHAQLYSRERGLVAELTELDRAKADFVTSVAHELRTPLASIVSHTNLLRAGDAGALTPVQDGMMRIVERNTDQLLQLLDDLLTVARIEAGSLAFHPIDVDPAAMIRKTVEALRPTLADRRLELAVDVDDALPALRADPEQMGRALRNVLSNAVNFTPDGGTVHLRATASDDEVTFVVADTGAPAPEPDDTFAHVFRSSPAGPAALHGGGLGLTIVKLVVEGHGGTVDVTSAPGQGTTVNVRLPLERDDLATQA
jgi:signal transduction histidine kinase/CHASE3 domain sensor protein